MNLLRLVRASIYSPSFYRSLLEKPFSFSFTYYALLSIALAVVFSVSFSYRAIPAAADFLGTVGDELVRQFPDDLELSIRGGTVTVNQQEPYRLVFPENLRNGTDTRAPANLLVVDTRQPFSLERFREYDTTISPGTPKGG
jgi:hypothetical protein